MGASVSNKKKKKSICARSYQYIKKIELQDFNRRDENAYSKMLHDRNNIIL